MTTDWEDLSRREWVRKRWRQKGAGSEKCLVCGAAFNRPDTYYVRPAYTDGTAWMCSGCFDRMKDEIGEEHDHRYGRRP